MVDGIEVGIFVDCIISGLTPHLHICWSNSDPNRLFIIKFDYLLSHRNCRTKSSLTDSYC